MKTTEKRLKRHIYLSDVNTEANKKGYIKFFFIFVLYTFPSSANTGPKMYILKTPSNAFLLVDHFWTFET